MKAIPRLYNYFKKLKIIRVTTILSHNKYDKVFFPLQRARGCGDVITAPASPDAGGPALHLHLQVGLSNCMNSYCNFTECFIDYVIKFYNLQGLQPPQGADEGTGRRDRHELWVGGGEGKQNNGKKVANWCSSSHITSLTHNPLTPLGSCSRARERGGAWPGGAPERRAAPQGGVWGQGVAPPGHPHVVPRRPHEEEPGAHGTCICRRLCTGCELCCKSFSLFPDFST